MRNLLAMLLLSQGAPMLLGGDELGRTQGGNNNAYCQDNEISWLDWEMDDEAKALLEFTRRAIALRRDHIVFHRSRFFRGQAIPGTDVKDVVWLRPDGTEMNEESWAEPHAKALGVRLSGEAGLMHLTARGHREPDDTFLVFMNAAGNDTPFRLPDHAPGARWEVLIDTSDEQGEQVGKALVAGSELAVKAHSLQLLVSAKNASH